MIKVERPVSGDFARAYDSRVKGLASHFVWTNRSKESLTLDLKHADAGEIVGRLLAKADVLVQNLAPGAAARMGLSFEALHETYPRLIVCDISGYGDDPERPGPYRDKKAYDLLIQSESGFLSITGTADEPAKAGCSIADIAAGMYAYSGILSALIERGRTGKGRRVDVSMLESMVEWMSYPLYYAFDGAAPPPRAGAAHATIYPYGPFPAGDGRTVMLGLQNEREWVAFCRFVLEQPALADRSALRLQRGAHRGARGAARDHRRGLRDAQRRAGRGAPRRGADRQRARQHDGRRLGASAARGARGAGSTSRRRRARCRRCCRRPRTTAATRAWTRCRRSARTPRRCSPRSASTRRRSSGCAATARSDASSVSKTHGTPRLVFACAHLCDERLFAAQIDALGDDFDCRVFVFRDDDSLARHGRGAARRARRLASR